MSRPSRDSSMLQIAANIALRSTCSRRNVGCVLTDKHGRIISVGHNGVPASMEHCVSAPCPGADYPSGTELDICRAVHAEANALIFCPDIMKIHTCYTTTSPCCACIKMILNSSCERIVFLEEYSQKDAEILWHLGRRGLGGWVKGSL